jgi:hypothetical protein
MTDDDLTYFFLLAVWGAWSLARIVAALRRIADAHEGLLALAKRGRP